MYFIYVHVQTCICCYAYMYICIHVYMYILYIYVYIQDLNSKHCMHRSLRWLRLKTQETWWTHAMHGPQGNCRNYKWDAGFCEELCHVTPAPDKKCNTQEMMEIIEQKDTEDGIADSADRYDSAWLLLQEPRTAAAAIPHHQSAIRSLIIRHLIRFCAKLSHQKNQLLWSTGALYSACLKL